MSRVPLAGGLPSILLALLTAAAGAEDWYVDRAAQAGLDFVHFNGMSGRLYYPEVVGSGAALFDYDNDGDLDLYLVQGGMLGPGLTMADALTPWTSAEPLTDRLYRNDLKIGRDGSRSLAFVDVTERSGISASGYGMGVAAADYDGDGFVDLYVTNMGSNQLWHNAGDGTFTDVTEIAGVDDTRWSVSASFVDYDRDGWLDLLVIDYIDFSFFANKSCLTERGEKDYCLPSAYRPVPSSLFRNRGDGTFENVSATSGVGTTVGHGLGVVVGDFNGDGLVDFYVANDLLPNYLWLNQGDGSFVDDGLAAGCALNREGKAEASMGVDAADYDGDGDRDLFMTHFRRETNTFFRNDGEGFFEDASGGVELANSSWEFTSFGVGSLDYDNDGWLDLVIANGAVTFVPGADRGAKIFPLDETNQVFRNLGGQRFEEVTGSSGEVFSLSEVSRAAVVGDVDNDGDGDVVITNNNGPVRLLVNTIGQRNHWLGLRLVEGVEGAQSASGDGDRKKRKRDKDPLVRDVLGAAVTISLADGRRLHRWSRSDGGYASARDPRVLFGLGDDLPEGQPNDVRLLVRWPDGTIERWRGVALDAYSTLLRGSGRP